MTKSRVILVKNVGWSVAGFGAGQVIRFATNVILARLLAPELFGIMTVVNTLRTGVDLLSDVGIGQNIVQQRNAEDPQFYNTAWTLQVLRGFLLWLACCAIAIPLARFYERPILGLVLPVAGLYFVFGGFSSPSRFLLLKRLQLRRLNAFEIIVLSVSAGAHVLLAAISPTIWALVLGGVFASAAGTIGSYFLLADLRYEFRIVKRYAWQIVAFGKWIFLSSTIYFLATSFDRLYLAKVIPFATLGVYSVARSFSDMLGQLAMRLGSTVVFPLVSSSFDTPRHQLREQLASMRLIFLVGVALALSFLAATGDLLVEALYDQRYQAAGWMFSVLVIGTWFSILCNLNEPTLLGFGKSAYGAVANSLKFSWLLIGLPIGFMKGGVLGAVMVVAVSDLFRYGPIFIGQIRERFSFGVQDSLATLLMIAALGLWEWLRWALGFGTSFDGFSR
jgi:O-antigen/teichoic acid export membrane protein